MARHGHRRLGRPDQGQVQRLRQLRLPEAGSRWPRSTARSPRPRTSRPKASTARPATRSRPTSTSRASTGTRNPTNPTCAPPFSYPTTGSSARQCRYDFASQIETIPETEKTNIVAKRDVADQPRPRGVPRGRVLQGQLHLSRLADAGHRHRRRLRACRPSSPYYPAAFIASVGGDPTKPVDVPVADEGVRAPHQRSRHRRVPRGGRPAGHDLQELGLRRRVQLDRERADRDRTPAATSANRSCSRSCSPGVVNPFGANTEAVRNQVLSDAGQRRHPQVDGHELRRRRQGLDRDLQAAGRQRGDGAGRRLAQGRARHHQHRALPVGRRHRRLGRDPVAGRRQSRRLGDLRRVQHPDRQDGRSQRRHPLRRLQRLRRHDQPEDLAAVAADQAAAGPRLVGHRVPRADAERSVRADADDQHLWQLRRPAALPDDPVGPATASASSTRAVGGNPDLQPETSTQWYAGIVWEPFDNLSLGVDFFQIKIEDAFTFVSAGHDLGHATSCSRTQVFRKPNVDPQYPEPAAADRLRHRADEQRGQSGSPGLGLHRAVALAGDRRSAASASTSPARTWTSGGSRTR